MEKFTISRSTASLITDESKGSPVLKEANITLLTKRMLGKPWRSLQRPGCQLPEGSLWGYIKPQAQNQQPQK
jgi:hypothetical protein